ncbi:MAG: hypothetical protein R3C59_19005 [Planctomycetaceae bacterium]
MKRTPTPSSLAKTVAACATASGESRTALIRQLLDSPEASLAAILRFNGPFPAEIHGRDFLDTNLPAVLEELVRTDPNLFLGKPHQELLRANAFLVLSVALSLKDRRFIPLILAGLRCPSIYARLQVVRAISHEKYLRVPEARQELERLLTLKSISSNEYDRTQIEDALGKFSK